MEALIGCSSPKSRSAGGPTARRPEASSRDEMAFGALGRRAALLETGARSKRSSIVPDRA